jgi:two-component system sensor histidine kinase ChiS
VDYITKPFHFQEVMARVRAHVTIRKLLEKLKTRYDAQTSELTSVNDAYGRFVPHQFLSYLNKESITQVKLADHEEREMTIMFADIRDFTGLSERMNPQENFRFLNSYLSRVSPVIGQHHGFIDKYIGDEIMALFPRSSDDAVSGRHRIADRSRALQSASRKLRLRSRQDRDQSPYGQAHARHYR